MSLTESSPVEAAKLASLASRELATLSSSARNDALTALHQSLVNAKDSILEANARDLELASTAAANGELSQSVFKRLDLGKPGKYEDMLKGVLDVRDLEDPSTFMILVSCVRKPSLTNSCSRKSHPQDSSR